MNLINLCVLVYICLESHPCVASESADSQDAHKRVIVWKSESVPQPLTQCYQQNQKQMDRCLDHAFDSWGYYHKLSYATDRQLSRAACCAMWDGRDCQLKTAKYYCTDEAADELYDLWRQGSRSWARSNDCEYYSFGYHSANCKLTDWAIALIVIASVVVLALIVFISIKCIQRRRLNARRQTAVKFNSVNYNRP